MELLLPLEDRDREFLLALFLHLVDAQDVNEALRLVRRFLLLRLVKLLSFGAYRLPLVVQQLLPILEEDIVSILPGGYNLPALLLQHALLTGVFLDNRINFLHEFKRFWF